MTQKPVNMGMLYPILLVKWPTKGLAINCMPALEAKRTPTRRLTSISSSCLSRISSGESVVALVTGTFVVLLRREGVLVEEAEGSSGRVEGVK